ncbi:MAG: hypothetical protein AAB869_01970 [Patescibacteria group bacterium]
MSGEEYMRGTLQATALGFALCGYGLCLTLFAADGANVGVIYGRIIIKETKKPMNGVIVKLWSRSKETFTVTDKNGKFQFHETPAGAYRVGFAGRRLFSKGGEYENISLAFIPNVVVGKGESREINVEARLGAEINGRIIDSEGNALAGAMVTTGSSNPESQILESDLLGKIVVKGVDPSRECILRILPRKYKYSKNVTVNASEMKAGAVCVIQDVVFPKLTDVRNLSGKVTDGGNKTPHEIFGLYVDSEDGKIVGIARATEGEFSIEIPPGKYRIRHGDVNGAYRIMKNGITIKAGEKTNVEIDLSKPLSEVTPPESGAQPNVAPAQSGESVKPFNWMFIGIPLLILGIGAFAFVMLRGKEAA